MSFLENLARKSELKAREKMFEAFAAFDADDVDWGSVPIPCHIIEETHNGLFVMKGQTVLVAYACQGAWWGYPLNPKLLEALQGPLAFTVHLMFENLMSPENLTPYPGQGPSAAAASFVYAVEQVESERAG